MADVVNIPDGFSRQVEDFSRFEDIAPPGADSLMSQEEAARQQHGLEVFGKVQRLPSQFPVDLTPEESTECWTQARKQLPSGSKHEVQRRALELIQRMSFAKQAEQDQEAARRRDRPRATKKRSASRPEPRKAESKVPKRRVPKRSVKRVKQADTPPKSKVVSRPRRVVQTPQPSINVTLSRGDDMIANVADEVIENEAYVVVVLSGDQRQDGFSFGNSFIHQTGILEYYGEDEDSGPTVKVSVLPLYFRYEDNDFYVFLRLPDGV